MKNSINGKNKHRKNNKLLDLYIRNNKKQALLLHTPPRTDLNYITSTIASRLHVPPEAQRLYHNGHQLNLNEATANFEDKAVIHLVDQRNIQPQITINIRRLHLPSRQQFRIPSSQLIEDFIVRHIAEEESQKMFLVYAGRQLHRNRSFAEELVQNDSELYCLHQDRDQLQGERRQYYQSKLKKKAIQKEKSEKSQKCELQENEDDVLKNYLPREPKEQEKAPSQKSDKSSEKESKVEIKPNFKKKNTLHEVNISGNHPHKKLSVGENNLSMIGQNLQENPSALNSQYFGDGSSISEIVHDSSHNPENSRKNQDGSMFQSAYMGLNNEPSLLNQQPSRALSSLSVPQEEDNNDKQSFNFDTRAPQMIPQPSDRQFTVLQRQIIEVAQSQQLSQQNSKTSSVHKQYDQQQSKSDPDREHSQQFELGIIQNHMLSASTQMRVQDPTSPIKLSKPKQSYAILIQDEQNQVKQEEHQESSNLQSRSDEKFKSEQKTIKQSKSLSVETPAFNQLQQDNVDFYLIENSEPQSQLSEVAEEKEECQTNHPSSSSNFFSKNSSRALQNQASNEYQFARFEKHFNRPSGSRNIEPTHAKQPFEEHSKSDVDPQEKGNNHNDSQDLQLQVVDLPTQIKAKEHLEMLLNTQSELQLKNKFPAFHQKPEQAKKEMSKIDELNNLISATPEKEEKSLHEAAFSQGGSLVQIDVSLNKVNQLQTGVLRESHQSLQQVRIKKTLVSFSTGTKLDGEEKIVQKQHFAAGQYIYKHEFAYFDPLNFYLGLLQQQNIQAK